MLWNEYLEIDSNKKQDLVLSHSSVPQDWSITDGKHCTERLSFLYERECFGGLLSLLEDNQHHDARLDSTCQVQERPLPAIIFRVLWVDHTERYLVSCNGSSVVVLRSFVWRTAECELGPNQKVILFQRGSQPVAHTALSAIHVPSYRRPWSQCPS